MSFFGKDGEQNENEKAKKSVESKLGRGITSIESATNELFFKEPRKDPIPFIKKAAQEDKNFYGFIHNGDKKGEPFFIDEAETTHEVFIGSTGTGKGVGLGGRAYETIEKRKGLIIIAPKKDDFLPQICLEALKAQGREKDFQVISWPYNFGYTGINEDDDYLTIANKLIDALNLTPSSDPGVDHYRKNGRVVLKQVLKIFFNGDLGVLVKKDFNEILTHIRLLKEDLEKQSLYEKEIGKTKPNSTLLKKYEKKFFDMNLVNTIYWSIDAVETLDSLSKSLSEIAEGATIFSKYTLKKALYDGGVLCVNIDMLDVASLTMVKMLLTDAIQQARRKKANVNIIADELSFYVSSTISGALATVRSFGIKFFLAFQDIAQLPEEVRAPILSNDNVKIFYKTSDEKSLDYITKVGGKELVTKYTSSVSSDSRYTQDTEDFLNTTRIRALPRTEVAIVIAEALPCPVIIRTVFVAVSSPFDWNKYENIEKTNLSDVREREHELKQKIKYNYKTTIKEVRLLENSDLLGIEYGCELI